ncbi:DNA processing protein DprA [Marinobacterium nitratireducens]|uniref:DNA processing protein DprA n=1 Tax=Marinobacterium nitratireducens TaxID=518897 RepID=A0A917ZAG2_9GAMM|nr:DNA-processing protein DprA [Marinobacterium nitratireducens]GGO77443.1 DNA processing protein DprA [Marinobacterium nitratireducens]
MSSDPRDWIAASLLPGIGAVGLKRLAAAQVPPSRLLDADSEALSLSGARVDTVRALDALAAGRGEPAERLERCLEWLDSGAARCLCPDAEDYPALLWQIPDPPPLLFVRGDAGCLAMPQLALVGSRHASRAGAANAYAFARALSEAGLVITSGLALGIDGAAHQAAVDRGAATVAVFGTGLDRVYPRRHRKLAQTILDTGGAWVSECLPGTAPLPGNFPRRNRIISGLSAGVLVVEAAPRSGSLITARMALEQGREVFAIPGSIQNPAAHGCHRLIREGAVLVETVAHVIEQLGPLLGSYLPAETPAPLPQGLSEPEANLLDKMGYDVAGIDQLVVLTGLSAPELMPLLVSLELKGAIEPVAGGYLRR